MIKNNGLNSFIHYVGLPNIIELRIEIYISIRNSIIFGNPIQMQHYRLLNQIIKQIIILWMIGK